MRAGKEEMSSTTLQPIDLVSAVKDLHILSTLELSKLIRDADNDIIQWTDSNESSKQINLETLVRYLPWHLIAKLLESKQDEELLRYLLGGIRLLHALYDLATRNTKLEQVLLEDMKISEQMFDLIFFMILVLSGFRQESQLAALHSALLACSLNLITAFVSSQWNELEPVLLAHPKVDTFVFGSFAAVHRDIQFILVRLSVQNDKTSMQSNLAEVNRICQHTEASLQFLQSLCQQKLFRERLVTNKDLCEEGGILLLANDIMKLPFCEDSYLMAVFSRLKSKVLSILLNLCEVESVSFLDVAASTTKGLNLAKSTISKVIELLKVIFRGDLNTLASFSDKTYPRGLLQLNAMRLTDVLSDDSNFRSYITLNFTEVLTTIFLQPHVDFLSSWCSSGSRPAEEDATLDYDSFTASGWVLGVLTSSDVPESTFNPSRVPRTSYAFQKTSLLVKVVANLTCFIPDICREEKDLFLNTFMQCFQKDLSSNSRTEKAAIVIQNLRSLSMYAESLIPGFLNNDDVELFRSFIEQLEPIIMQESDNNRVTEVHSTGQNSSNAGRNTVISDNSPVEEANQLNLTGNEDQRTDLAPTFTPVPNPAPTLTPVPNPAPTLTPVPRAVKATEEGAQNVETTISDANTAHQSEEKQVKKRKRNILNHMQITMIEQALQIEPEMQRNAASIQLWSEKLSLHGSEITPSQLKNWVNNRKAKLARVAAKDNQGPSGGDNITFTDKQGGSGTDPDLESADEFFDPTPSTGQPTQLVKHEPGQFVVLTDGKGDEIGKGFVHQASGSWSGANLDESGLCVVDITYLKVDKWTSLPHPCHATGTSYGHSEQIIGVKRVLWDSSKLVVQQRAG
ncbi:nodulin homeobox-like isoform X2 [Bidens hawaiensis]|uniref:nodulin homeobox-like isoform X2 n=1 Tax=Bidens hawaiensis TaxID=980011 RepID=UPI004049DBC1